MMLKKKHIEQLFAQFQRIFALKIGRTTYREIQSAVLVSVEGDRDLANKLLEAVATGDFKDSIVDKEASGPLRNMINGYCIPVRLSRDVYEHGDFIQVITSDIASGERTLFVNRIRRIDGEELQFVTDGDSTLQILQHFVGRMEEIANADGNSKEIEGYRKELTTVRDRINQLLHAEAKK